MTIRIHLITLALCTVFSISAHAQKKQLRMCVLSDTHIMAPQLLKKEGKAFDAYLHNDRKLLRESPELLDSAMAIVRRQHPRVLLITGDLTKDGELLSHEYLIEHYLRPLRKEGVRIFVVPGNHDINNPHAVVYDGERKERTATIQASDFPILYKDYGYGEALAHDTASLSYAVELMPGIRLIAIDACKYYENDFSKDLCETSGRIKPATLAFIAAQAAEAKAKGEKVLAMIHHGLAPHFRMEDVVLSEYLVDDFDVLARKFSEMGIKVVFSGHLHSQDIAREGDLVDVETGSVVSYPHPVRTVDIDGDTLHITSTHIADLGSMMQGERLMEKSKRFVRSSAAVMADTFLPAETPKEMKAQVEALAGEAYLLHLAGDEKAPAQYLQALKQFVAVASPYYPVQARMLGLIARYMSEDILPADNNADITF